MKTTSRFLERSPIRRPPRSWALARARPPHRTMPPRAGLGPDQPRRSACWCSTASGDWCTSTEQLASCSVSMGGTFIVGVPIDRPQAGRFPLGTHALTDSFRSLLDRLSGDHRSTEEVEVEGVGRKHLACSASVLPGEGATSGQLLLLRDAPAGLRTRRLPRGSASAAVRAWHRRQKNAVDECLRIRLKGWARVRLEFRTSGALRPMCSKGPAQRDGSSGRRPRPA
jgi:hypothetical protein